MFCSTFRQNNRSEQNSSTKLPHSSYKCWSTPTDAKMQTHYYPCKYTSELATTRIHNEKVHISTYQVVLRAGIFHHHHHFCNKSPFNRYWRKAPQLYCKRLPLDSTNTSSISCKWRGEIRTGFYIESITGSGIFPSEERESGRLFFIAIRLALFPFIWVSVDI